MIVRLKPTGGLKAIMDKLPPEIKIEIDEPARVREIIARAGINPLVVLAVVQNGVRIDKDSTIDSDTELTLIGPAAGG